MNNDDSIDYDTLSDMLEQVQALHECLKSFPSAKDAEQVVADVMGSVHAEVDASADIDIKDIDIVLNDRSKKSIVQDMADKLDQSRNIVDDVYQKMLRTVVFHMKKDIEQPQTETMILDPYTWLRAMGPIAPTELMRGVFAHIDPNGATGQSWIRNIPACVSPKVVYEEFQRFWRDDNEKARSWEPSVLKLVNSDNAEHVLDKFFSPLWRTHAVRAVVAPQETFYGQSHVQVCSRLQQLGANMSWENLNLAPLLGSDPTSSAPQQADSFFAGLLMLSKMDREGAAQALGSLSDNGVAQKTGWSSWASRVSGSPLFYQSLQQKKSLLHHMAEKDWVGFASLQHVCRAFDASMKNEEKCWEQKLLDCCATIQAEILNPSVTASPRAARKM